MPDFTIKTVQQCTSGNHCLSGKWANNGGCCLIAKQAGVNINAEERINAETESLLKKGKIKEYNSKMEEAKACRLYFDEAYKYTNFYEEGDE